MTATAPRWTLAAPRGPPLARAAVLTVLAALATFAVLTLGAGPARAAEQRTASWAVARLEVVSKGQPKRMPEGSLIDGYTLKARATARPGAPVGDGTLVVVLGAFSPSRDLPGQPRGLHYVKGTWRLVAEGAEVPGARGRGPQALHGFITAALPSDPTARTGGFTLRTRVAPGALRGLRDGDGSLTVNEAGEAELVLTLR